MLKKLKNPNGRKNKKNFTPLVEWDMTAFFITLMMIVGVIVLGIAPLYVSMGYIVRWGRDVIVVLLTIWTSYIVTALTYGRKYNQLLAEYNQKKSHKKQVIELTSANIELENKNQQLTESNEMYMHKAQAQANEIKKLKKYKTCLRELIMQPLQKEGSMRVIDFAEACINLGYIHDGLMRGFNPYRYMQELSYKIAVDGKAQEWTERINKLDSYEDSSQWSAADSIVKDIKRTVPELKKKSSSTYGEARDRELKHVKYNKNKKKDEDIEL